MKSVMQKHPEGCALACAAMLSNRSYEEIADIGDQLDIRADDKALYTGTEAMRCLLDQLGIRVASTEVPFTTWDTLPNKALLAIKWYIEEGLAMWHWVVFFRDESGNGIFDPAPYLDNPVRKDLSEIHPKWFIEVLP